MTTPVLTLYQSQHYAWLLTRRAAGNTVESLASTLVDSQVDLNPHQVEAALFACRNPLSRGVILADEVGLGKTIEAGLVISQRWAERRRRILIIVPANLRKQWYQELQDKFGLQGLILLVAEYLRRPNLKALPEGQRQLISLVLVKRHLFPYHSNFGHFFAGLPLVGRLPIWRRRFCIGSGDSGGPW
ncbi:MAG: SNF2-related protein, partial [Methylococcaceae bacterium]|nr:SNF2-related protein [Methylococcaceae bacterium]